MCPAETISVAPPRGMRDLLPKQVALRDWASKQILNAYTQFGFSRIETPVLENIQLLKGGEGGENLQLIYEVLKRGEKLDKALEKTPVLRDDLSDLGLRFDLTVPLVRYFSANQNELPYPLKAIQIGPVFRAESPQKGRFRQFTQCDIDIIGIKSELAEIELITASAAALNALGFEDFCIHINDRRILTSLALSCGFSQSNMSSCFIALDKLDKIGLDNLRKELLSGNELNPEPAVKLCGMLASFLELSEEQKGDFASLQKIFAECLNNENISQLEKIIAAVASGCQGKYRIKFDPTLVRGMGYYTGPIFEAKYPGYSGSIAGGGRYDKMVGKFSGRDFPACGFSIGFERVIDILTEKNFSPVSESKKIALIVDADRDDAALIFEAVTTLRAAEQSEIVVSIQGRKKDFKKQLDALVLQGYTHFCPYRGDPQNLELKELSK